MDPYNEQRLRDEVIYLHSLWHQGHPRSLPAVNLQPYISIRFKKPKNKPPKSKPRKKVGSFSGKEWPVKPLPADPPLTESGWPELKLKPNPQPARLPTPEELEKYNWNQVQRRALKVAKEFYSENSEDSDDEDEDDVVEDDDMIEDADDVDDKVHDFIWKLFDRDEELKAYYVKHCGGGGEFSCLVCGGASEKHGKRFKDCIALVQHSVSVAKTKKRRSHRAYGKVICKVLGWEIDRLPSSIVSDQKCNGLQGSDGNVLNDGENLNEKTHQVTENVDGESMVCEDIFVVKNVEEEHNKNQGQVLNGAEGCARGVVNNLDISAVKNVEEEHNKIQGQVLNEAEGCARGAVNNLCRNLSSTMVLEPVSCDLQTN